MADEPKDSILGRMHGVPHVVQLWEFDFNICGVIYTIKVTAKESSNSYHARELAKLKLAQLIRKRYATMLNPHDVRMPR